MTKRILFVCMGNICRSPAGEGVFRSLISKLNLAEAFDVDSAGTIGYHAGKPADLRMRQAAAQRGYRLDSISRKVVESDFENFDLIVAMDRDNMSCLVAMQQELSQPRAELMMLSDVLDDQWPTDVPDPYYGDGSGFEYVMDMIEAACPGLVDKLKTE